MRDIKIAVRQKIGKFVHKHDVPLLRLLYYSRWLRLGVFTVLCILIIVPLGITKIWRVTPEGFTPSIKISLLDTLQSWSLRRGALKAMASNEFDDAVDAWHSSIANNPTNENYQREYFQVLMDHDLRKTKTRQAVQNGFWYLHLTQTNHTALEIITDVFNFYHLHEINRQLLAQHQHDLTAKMEAKYLKSLFHMGNIGAFRTYLERMDPSRFEEDFELSLYQCAYMSIWGGAHSALPYVETLRSSLDHPKHASLAHSLNMQVSMERGEIASFKRSMDYMITRGVDRLIHHMQYWNLLVEHGQKDQAIDHLKRYNLPPNSATDVVRFADFASSLGEKDLASQYLRTYALDFGYYEPVWIAYANNLIDQNDWHGLNQAALHARRNPYASSTLKGFTFFMEGRAALGEQKYDRAEKLMAKAATFDYGIPSIGLYLGRKLGDLGFSSEAMMILQQSQSELMDETLFWETVFPLANAMGDTEKLLEAAENMYRLNSHRKKYRNNYAALLLSTRSKLEIAVSLTRELLNESTPKRHTHRASYQAALINHALALALNHRYEEAVEHLKLISRDSLLPEFEAGYHLAWFEVAMRMKDFDVARSHGLLVQKEQLLPADRLWYEKTWEKFIRDM